MDEDTKIIPAFELLIEDTDDEDDEEYYCCGKCEGCGVSSCECECPSDTYCDDCDCDPCGCSEGHGHRTTAPWEERGAQPFDTAAVRGREWQSVWPEINEQIDPIMEAGNYYLLEAMASNVVFPNIKVRKLAIPDPDVDREFFDLIGLNADQREAFVKARNEQIEHRLATDPRYKMADISARAAEMLSELVEQLDPTFVHYSHMAVAGEARHHKALGGRWFMGHREQAWVEWRPMYEKLGNQGLLDLAELFMEFDEGTAFGGKKWADACKVLYNRLEGKLGPDEATNKRLFIDRVFTLEHNGGCFLNKITWSVKNRRRWNVGYMKNVLDAHANDDYRILFGVADTDVKGLFREYCQAAVEIVGSDHPEWMGMLLGNVKPRAICPECYSNPALGHQNRCYVIRNSYRYDDFDGIVDLNVSKSWYIIVDNDNFDEYDWSRWHPDGSGYVYPIGPKGKQWSRSQDVEVTVGYGISSTGRGYYDGVKNYSVKLGDLADGKFKVSLKQFNKKAGPIGSLLDASYWVTITLDYQTSHTYYSDPYKTSPTEVFDVPIVPKLPAKILSNIEA